MAELGLGRLVHTVGRDESTQKQWGQAILLGALFDLFFAPALGFPILSQGPRYALFGLNLVGVGVGFVLLVKAARTNRAVRFYEGGVELVRGRLRAELSYRIIKAVRYDPRTKRLVVDLGDAGVQSLRLSPGLGKAVMTEFRKRGGFSPSALA